MNSKVKKMCAGFILASASAVSVSTMTMHDASAAALGDAVLTGSQVNEASLDANNKLVIGDETTADAVNAADSGLFVSVFKFTFPDSAKVGDTYTVKDVPLQDIPTNMEVGVPEQMDGFTATLSAPVDGKSNLTITVSDKMENGSAFEGQCNRTAEFVIGYRAQAGNDGSFAIPTATPGPESFYKDNPEVCGPITTTDPTTSSPTTSSPTSDPSTTSDPSSTDTSDPSDTDTSDTSEPSSTDDTDSDNTDDTDSTDTTTTSSPNGSSMTPTPKPTVPGGATFVDNSEQHIPSWEKVEGGESISAEDNEQGAEVNTGGHVEDKNFFQKLVSVFTG